ncbi:hypothetical protein HG531_010466 [Fusarium graminearum]|nr:hypothetical protein HG531_010466 [Fusarium graminearum]
MLENHYSQFAFAGTRPQYLVITSQYDRQLPKQIAFFSLYIDQTPRTKATSSAKLLSPGWSGVLEPLFLLLDSRLADILSALEFLLAAHTISETSHALLSCLVDTLLANLEVVAVLVCLFGCPLLLVLVAYSRGEVGGMAGRTWTYLLADVRKLAEAVGTLPLVEAAALEAGCDFDTTLSADHLCALGAVLVVLSRNVLPGLLVPTHLGTGWFTKALGILVIGEIHGDATGSLHKVGRILTTR